MNTLISVIVPCYNQAQYLHECLQSVLDQTYENWECLIINDGSPDNTEEVAKNWIKKDSRFKYFYKENGGLSSARNLGIKKSIGEWIQFLDCDDLLEKNKLRNQHNSFIPSIDIYISGYRYFLNDEGKNKQRIFGRNDLLPEVCLTTNDYDLKELFSQKNPFVISAPIYNKSVFEKVGNFSEELTSLEDWEFNFRCALHDQHFKHTGYAEEDKVLIRLHSNSMMSDVKRMQDNSIKARQLLNENELYVKYFGKINSKAVSLNFKETVALFMPPIFFKFISRFKK